MVEWVITFVAGMMTGTAMLALLVAFFMRAYATER